jgi:hypothetical protein
MSRPRACRPELAQSGGPKCPSKVALRHVERDRCSRVALDWDLFGLRIEAGQVSGRAKARSVDRITRLAGRHQDLGAFGASPRQSLTSRSAAVGGPCWLPMDPASLLDMSNFNVTWVDGEFWHGIWQGDESDMRRVDPRTGEVCEQTLEMPRGVAVSGLESAGGDHSSAPEARAGRWKRSAGPGDAPRREPRRRRRYT